MIVYSIEHFMGIYQMLTLRLVKHRNEKAVLIAILGENTIRQKADFFAKLKKTELFDDIVMLKEISLIANEDGSSEVAAPFSSTEELQAKIVATYKPIIEEHNLNLAEAATIYSLEDITSDFTSFLSHLGIPYIHVENFSGYINEIYAKAHIAKHPRHKLRQKECSVNKNNRPLRKIVLFSETALLTETPLSEKEQQLLEFFDFNKKFNQVAEEDRLKFLSCFNLDLEFLQSHDLTILLPNSVLFTGVWAGRARAKFSDILYFQERYGTVYAMLLDYFANKNNAILYHPHPNRIDSINMVDFISERGANHVDQNMPIEFLAWIPNIKIKQTLSIKTTALQKLASIVQDDISLDIEFLSVFNIMDRLYTMQTIINNLPHSNIKFYGIPDKTMQTLYRCNFDDYPNKIFECLETVESLTLNAKPLLYEPERSEDPKTLANTTLQQNDICIINTTLPCDEPIVQRQLILNMLETADENAVIFFTNIFHEYSFAHVVMKNRVFLDFIVPIIIHRTKLDDGEPVGELGTITIYAFCKNEETRNQLKATSITKNLHYLNTILTVTPLSDEDAQSEYQKCWEHAINNALTDHMINLRHKDSTKALKEELAQEKQAMQQEMAAMQQQLYQANYQLQQEKTAHQATKTELETATAKQNKGFFSKFGKR
ncbi:MAG: hypothetical protein FWG68_04555 [Defluviitaleaceae bacterium]|nr:hypothetical protein [Defluviitaleaceae bacterium]